ncbi:MAG: PAS domain-containing protein [Proteobacteria bacterium]|nr:PAS domain-containing protein [Pseudomonadota bacterium]
MPVISRLSMQPNLRQIYDLWAKMKGAGTLPLLAKMPTERLREWLPNLAIIAVRQDNDYIYRYYGQTFVEAFGVDMTGLNLDSLPHSQRTILEQEYDYVRTRSKPSWRIYSGEFFGAITTYERLILPFAKSGGTVSTLMVAAYEVKNDGLFDIH